MGKRLSRSESDNAFRAMLDSAGVRHKAHVHADYYYGTRKVLIQVRVAQRSWFPDKDIPSTKRAGAIKRNFRLKWNGRGVFIQQYAPVTDRWEVKIETTPDERARRARQEAERSHDQEINDWSAEPGTMAAAFDVNDRVLVYKPECEGHLSPATVVAGYGLQSFRDHDGTVCRRWGYLVQHRGNLQSYFCTANELREYAHKPFHVRLVVNNGQATRYR